MDANDHIPFTQISTDVAVLKEKIVGIERAISKQALEYERRLTELNHAHAQQVARNETYVPRETADANARTITERFNALQKQVSDIDAWKQRVTGIQIGIAIGAGLTGGSVGALLVKFIGH